DDRSGRPAPGRRPRRRSRRRRRRQLDHQPQARRSVRVHVEVRGTAGRAGRARGLAARAPEHDDGVVPERLKRDGPLPEPIISHVSDTARWVAVYRARETERRDALFRDPLAARLAGGGGAAIAAAAPRGAGTGRSAVTRTKLIDDLVLDSVAQGCDRVVNLAAGFDTRPSRLALARTLTCAQAEHH